MTIWMLMAIMIVLLGVLTHLRHVGAYGKSRMLPRATLSVTNVAHVGYI